MDPILVQSRINIVNTFNYTIDSLLNKIIAIDPDSIHLKSLKNKIHAVLKVDEEILIKTSGPYLVRYRDEILNRKEEFFCTPGYLENKEKQISGDQTIQNVLNLCRQVYGELDSVDQDSIYNKVLDLFAKYMDFLENEQLLNGK